MKSLLNVEQHLLDSEMRDPFYLVFPWSRMPANRPLDTFVYGMVSTLSAPCWQLQRVIASQLATEVLTDGARIPGGAWEKWG